MPPDCVRHCRVHIAACAARPTPRKSEASQRGIVAFASISWRHALTLPAILLLSVAHQCQLRSRSMRSVSGNKSATSLLALPGAENRRRSGVIMRSGSIYPSPLARHILPMADAAPQHDNFRLQDLRRRLTSTTAHRRRRDTYPFQPLTRYNVGECLNPSGIGQPHAKIWQHTSAMHRRSARGSVHARTAVHVTPLPRQFWYSRPELLVLVRIVFLGFQKFRSASRMFSKFGKRGATGLLLYRNS